MSGEGAGNVEERGEEPLFSFRQLYNLSMVFMKRGSSEYVFIGSSCEYKTQSERYYGANIQSPISPAPNSLS